MKSAWQHWKWESEKYGIKRKKVPPAHPGEVIDELCLKPLNITVSKAAGAMGVSRATLSRIVNAKRTVTPDMALRLSQAFQTSPELLLNMQRNYDLWYAYHKTSAWKKVKSLLKGRKPKAT